ncbi:acyl-CoA dehydrogenase family protein [Cupriavidus sp. YAF13]|uniref:acyl-CoA dehydrogenase family protein n=1 Tax=Cupriavidus sp. YAF13 TaxID=3233075 RepID=UPI003F915602
MHNAYSDALDSVLRDCCTPAVIRAIERGEDHLALWQSLQDSGFADCLLPEAAGGAGLPLDELAPVLFALGRRALPLPLGQTLFARALLHAAGLAVPAEPIALASFDMEDSATDAVLVAGGAQAAWFLVQEGTQCLLLPRARAQVRPTGAHADLAVVLLRPASDGLLRFALPAGTLRQIGACLHAVQLAGALSHVFDMTLRYANDRQQFGRAIGKFQAIQHQISVMAEHVTAARMAAQIACAGGGWRPDPLRAAIGKLNASEAVTPVAAIAHAVHGAIGITEEYDLQIYTRRLHAWQLADGSQTYWARVVGEAVCGQPGTGVVDLTRSWSTDAA